MLLKGGYDCVKVMIFVPLSTGKIYSFSPVIRNRDIVLDLLREYIRTAIGQLYTSPLGGIDINLVC